MAKTFAKGADPKGLVNRGVEGSGAAQIFRPSQAIQDFVTRQARGEQQKAAQKKAEAKAKDERQKNLDNQFKDLLKIDIKGWTEPDNQRLLMQYGEIEKQAAELKAKGMNPFDDNDLTMKVAKFQLDMGALQDQKKLFELANTKAYTLATNKNITPEQFTDYEQRIKTYASKPFEERMMPENLSLLDAPKVEEQIDLFKELKNIDIGYFTQADIDAETGLGEKSKIVVKDKLKSQSESLVNAKPKVYEYGINQGLWTNKKEAADWFYRNKFYQADTSKEDIVRTTSKSNMFGTGSNSKEIEEDFNKWKQDFKNGDENAASFLYNIQLPTGTKIEKFKVVPTVEQEQGYAAKGFAPRIKYMFKAVKIVDGQSIEEDLEIEPLIEDDTQLYKFYISAVKDKNRTYGKDVAERTSKTKVIQDKPTNKTNTLTKFKGVPKGGF
jgi:hypothetical protein